MNPIEFDEKLGDPIEEIKWLCLIYGKKSRKICFENLKKTLII